MEQPLVCPKCGAVMKQDDFCLMCGNKFEKAPEIPDAQNSKDKKKKPEKAPIQSIFLTLGENSDKIEELAPLIIKHKKFVPIVLASSLCIIGILAYYLFIYTNPDYASPIVLSAEDIKGASTADITENNIDQIPLTDLTKSEKTIELEINLSEGNFGKNDYFQFAPPDTRMVIHAFNISDIFSKYLDNEKFIKFQEYMDFDTDDIDVYLDKGFILLYPQDDFSTWGFVIEVNPQGKEFVSERAAKIAQDKEADEQNYEYKDYYVYLSSIGTSETEETTPEEDESDKNQTEQENSENPTEETASTDEQSTDENSGKFYLLVSNSKEYLDQMKESSEGNLLNLKNDATFARSKLDMPQIGQIFVYRQKDSAIWNVFADWISKKVDYAGIDKILKDAISQGITFYSTDKKLKIITSAE